jgi:hypothetical protein
MSQGRTLECRYRVMKPERVIVLLCAVGLLFAGCTPKPQGPITSAFDGVYHGNGYNASPPDWDCPAVMPADPLTVSGGEATFDDFSGWVAPDGSAQLSAQEGTINGRFEGRDFQGLLQYKVRMSPRLGCAYTLKMVRAG